MDIQKYIPQRVKDRADRFSLAVLIIAFLVFGGLVYSAPEKTGSGDKISWSQIVQSGYKDEYFMLYRYIDNYRQLSESAGIYRNIREYSWLNRFTAVRLTRAIFIQCRKYNIDPNLVFAIIMVESTFRPDAVSDKGAVGLMQILPSTAEYISGLYGYSYRGEDSLFDPVANVKLGTAYFAYLQRKLEDVEHALWAYNYGPSRFNAILRRNPSFIPQYVDQVMSDWDYFSSKN